MDEETLKLMTSRDGDLHMIPDTSFNKIESMCCDCAGKDVKAGRPTMMMLSKSQ